MSSIAARTGPRLRTARQRQNLAAYILVTPFFVCFIAMLLVPLLYSGYLSLFQTRLIGGETFSGLTNFLLVFQDPKFWSGLGRMGLFLVVQVPIMLGLALAFALAIDSGKARGQGAIRLLIFVPYAVPGAVATLMWGYLYGNDFGLIAQILRALSIVPPDLLAPGNILGSMMNIVAWEFVGYNMIIMYAALRSIPEELYEAAAIDGAGPFRIAWSIKIPAIRPAILLTVIFSIIGSFQLFAEPNLLRTIAPNAIDSAYTPNLYAYTLAFVNQNVNYAAAVAFVLGAVIAVVAFIVQKTTKTREG